MKNSKHITWLKKSFQGKKYKLFTQNHLPRDCFTQKIYVLNNDWILFNSEDAKIWISLWNFLIEAKLFYGELGKNSSTE